MATRARFRRLRARPEAGEWLQRAALANRASVPLEVPHDTIQPFPAFSEIYVAAPKALRGEITAARQPVGQENAAGPASQIAMTTFPAA